jgi:hypothetical protein
MLNNSSDNTPISSFAMNSNVVAEICRVNPTADMAARFLMMMRHLVTELRQQSITPSKREHLANLIPIYKKIVASLLPVMGHSWQDWKIEMNRILKSKKAVVSVLSALT